MTEFEFHNLPVYQRVISYEYRGSPENFSQRIFDEVNDVLSSNIKAVNPRYRNRVIWDVSARQQGNLVSTLFVMNMNYKRGRMIETLRDEIGRFKILIYEYLKNDDKFRPETTIEEHECECNKRVMYDELDNLLYQKTFWMEKYQSFVSK
jgi:hypothetical protein